MTATEFRERLRILMATWAGDDSADFQDLNEQIEELLVQVIVEDRVNRVSPPDSPMTRTQDLRPVIQHQIAKCLMDERETILTCIDERIQRHEDNGIRDNGPYDIGFREGFRSGITLARYIVQSRTDFNVFDESIGKIPL
jgi:uncharacterized protein (DUF1786 family)